MLSPGYANREANDTTQTMMKITSTIPTTIPRISLASQRITLFC
jgi:hypothetical protein